MDPGIQGTNIFRVVADTQLVWLSCRVYLDPVDR